MAVRWDKEVRLYEVGPRAAWEAVLCTVAGRPASAPVFFTGVATVASVPSVTPPGLVTEPLPVPRVAPPGATREDGSIPTDKSTVLASANEASIVDRRAGRWATAMWVTWGMGFFPYFLDPGGGDNELGVVEGDRDSELSKMDYTTDVTMPRVPLSWEFAKLEGVMVPGTLVVPTVIEGDVFLVLVIFLTLYGEFFVIVVLYGGFPSPPFAWM